MNKPPQDVSMGKAERKIEEQPKAPDSPMFTVEDVQEEFEKREYLIEEDIRKIELKFAKSALPIGSPILIQIGDSPKAASTPSSPASVQSLGMPQLALLLVDTPKASQENIFYHSPLCIHFQH